MPNKIKHRVATSRASTCIEAADSDEDARWKPWNGSAIQPMQVSDTRRLRQADTLIDSDDGIEQSQLMCVLCARYMPAVQATYLSMMLDPYVAMVNSTHKAAKDEYQVQNMDDICDVSNPACGSRECMAKAADRTFEIPSAVRARSTVLLTHMGSDKMENDHFVGGKLWVDDTRTMPQL